jgi:radical SAM enzyme (TIGR01210 family)
MKHSLGVLNRVTFSNEGSVLDIQSFPTDTLLVLSRCVQELRRVRTFVLETRLEFVKPETINQIDMVAPRARINILTGFETLNSCIRNKILGKQQTLEQFEEGLDKVAEASADLTAFVLFKPSQMMTDSEAYMEASASIDYLVEQCEERNVDLTIRLNPMYAAKGTIWAEIACHTSEYKPPRLTDVIDLAYQKSQEGVSVYIGLSTEGLNESWGSYQSREDFSRNLLKKAILFNNGVIS